MPMKRLCASDDVVTGKGREFSCAAGYLAVFQGEKGPVGYLNVCPHQARSLNFAPDEFLFATESRLVCPHHGAVFDVSSGECLEGPCKGARLTPVQLHLRDGDLWLEED